MKNYRTEFTSKSTLAEIVLGSLLAAALVLGSIAFVWICYCFIPAVVATILALSVGITHNGESFSFWRAFGVFFSVAMLLRGLISLFKR